MHVDWDQTINEILSAQMACQSCGVLGDTMVVGYTRDSGAAIFAARCKDCTDKTDCDARKLVAVCDECARKFRVNGSHMNEAGLMGTMMEETRNSLEESVDYLATYWKEEGDYEYDDMQRKLDEVDPELFREEDEWRRRLEEEYMQIHRWFRERGLRVPDPGWKSQYAEEVIALGYPTLLGD